MQKKPANYFYKIITFVLILSIAPVIIVGIFSYSRSATVIQDHVVKEKEQSIYQVQTNVEQILKSVDHALNHFVTSSQIKQALRQPLVAEQFQLYNLLREEMSQLQTYDSRVEDVLLVSFENNWLINNYGLQRLSAEQVASFKDSYLSVPLRSAWLLEEKNSTLYKTLGQKSCSHYTNIVKQVPLTSRNKTGIALATIPTCSFSDILKKTNSSETILVLDSENRIIGSSDGENAGAVYSNNDIITAVRDAEEDFGQFNTTLKDADYTVTYRKSIYNNWSYLSLVKISELNKQSSSIGWFTFIISAALVILSLIVALVGSQRIYRPVRKLQDVILQWSSPKEGVQPRNEFELIETQIHHMAEQNSTLEEKLQSQVSQLKQFFMIRLLDGKLQNDELSSKFQALGYSQDWKRLSVLSLQIDSLESSAFDKKEEDVLLFVINSLIENMIPQTHRMTPVVKNNTQITVLTSNHETEEQLIYYLNNIAETIQNKVKEELQITVSIGISQPFDDLSLAKGAYRESLEALKYTLKYGAESIIFFENLERAKAFHTFFPKGIESELFDAIKVGDKEQVDSLLEELLNAIFEKDLNHLQYQISIVRFMNDLIELMQTLGIDVLELEDNKLMFDELYNLKSKGEVRAWFQGMIIHPLMSKIEKRSESQYRNISDNIIHIIQEEFDTDLTLEVIAARLHYNPNYLSSIFRKEMNVSFSEYLSLYRLNMAKKWLLETSMSVKEISEKLNYNNPQNFIRSFRKSEGTTPGKYRELKKAL